MMARHRLSPNSFAITSGCREGGFTLVEMIMSIVLIGILAAVGSNMMSDSFTTTRMVDADTASKQQARYALERLAREIREIKYDTTNSQYCITSLTSSTNLAFNKTSGAYSSTCATNAITVTIDRSGASSPYNLTLQYSTPAVTSTLSNQVSSFALTYLDAAGTSTTSASNVRFVVITLTVTNATSGQSIAQRMRVALRNS